jgi:transcriptional regulator with XRE-family HTH domain
MKFKIDKEWLDRKLAKADDANASAGGTSFEEMKKNVDRRVVTPSSIAGARSELGKVVRFVREKKGISRHELATLASLSDEEIEVIETRVDYVPSLRSVIYLADALELSRDRLKELAGLVARASTGTQQSSEYRFAASSNPIDSISDEHYEAIRALVEVLSEKK